MLLDFSFDLVAPCFCRGHHLLGDLRIHTFFADLDYDNCIKAKADLSYVRGFPDLIVNNTGSLSIRNRAISILSFEEGLSPERTAKVTRPIANRPLYVDYNSTRRER